MPEWLQWTILFFALCSLAAVCLIFLLLLIDRRTREASRLAKLQPKKADQQREKLFAELRKRESRKLERYQGDEDG